VPLVPEVPSGATSVFQQQMRFWLKGLSLGSIMNSSKKIAVEGVNVRKRGFGELECDFSIPKTEPNCFFDPQRDVRARRENNIIDEGHRLVIILKCIDKTIGIVSVPLLSLCQSITVGKVSLDLNKIKEEQGEEYAHKLLRKYYLQSNQSDVFSSV
jgi:hypothetical protein